jgi:hypothetical protein
MIRRYEIGAYEVDKVSGKMERRTTSVHTRKGRSSDRALVPAPAQRESDASTSSKLTATTSSLRPRNSAESLKRREKRTRKRTPRSTARRAEPELTERREAPAYRAYNIVYELLAEKRHRVRMREDSIAEPGRAVTAERASTARTRQLANRRVTE